MESTPAQVSFLIDRLLAWLIAAAVIAVTVAALAFAAAQVAAPLVLFPLLVGGLLGGSLVLAMRIIQIGHRPTIMIGAMLAALIVVVGQHYASYLSELHSAEQTRIKFNDKVATGAAGISPELFADRMPQVPVNFADYMRKQADVGRPITGQLTLYGTYAWASWAVEGLLQSVVAIWIVWWAARLPIRGH